MDEKITIKDLGYGAFFEAAAVAGALNGEKYANYLNLKKEADFFAMSKFEKRDKDRQFGKFIKKAKKELKDFGHKN